MGETLFDLRPAAPRPVRRSPAASPLPGGLPGTLLGLQRAAGNAAVARSLIPLPLGRRPSPATPVQRCGPTPCDCSAEERAEYDATHAGRAAPTGDEADPASVRTIQRRATVQRQVADDTPIGDLAAGDVPAVGGSPAPSGPAAADGAGAVTDSNLDATVQRQPAPRAEPVVQRITRQEEIDLSLTSPGRAVLDPGRPSLSLFNFGIDRATPKPFHTALLAQFSAFLTREVTAPTRIRVVGHADPTGASPHNQTLSANRSTTVAAILQANGSATEVFAEGDGHPVASNSTVDGRSRNRRVDILVSATGPPRPPTDPERPTPDPDRSFCDRYPLLCDISPPGLPLPPWPLLCILVPELCLAIPCMVNPAMCVPPPPPPPPDRPDRPDRPGGSPVVIFGPVRAANTPAVMGDRIPDQGTTPVPVVVTGLDPASGPITIRVAGAPGANGDALVNGTATADITGSTLLAVGGRTQTQTSAHGFHLALEAVHGGNVVGRSGPFAVSAIMFDMATSTAGVISDPSGVTLESLMTKQSDGAAGIRSLNEMEYGEHLSLVDETGGMVGMGLGHHGFLALADIDQIDNHGTEMRHLLRPGSQTLHQTHSFLDHRTGSGEIPVAGSGFSVVREVSADPGRPGCLVFVVVKSGQAGTADGVASAAGSGVASARVPLPCPPGPNRPGHGPGRDPGNRTFPVPYTGPLPPGSTKIFYRDGVSASAAPGSFVLLSFFFRFGAERFFTEMPCVVVANTAVGVELESLNPVPVNVAPRGAPQPVVMPARMRMTVPRELLR